MADTSTSRSLDSDSLDESLVRHLREDGRASIRDLASALGVSRDLVSQRLRLLSERDGLRVVAALDPGFAGHHVLTHAMVEIEGPARPIAGAIADHPSTVFVSMTSGPMPIIFESRHADTPALHALLDQVRSIPGVRRVCVTTYVRIIKGFFVAEERGEIVVDALDTALISELQRDGRMSYTALANTVHLSPSSVRARVKRLIDAGAIRISTITSGRLTRTRLAIGLGITVRGDASAVANALTSAQTVDFAARAHGGFDFVATIVGTSVAELLATIEELRGVPEVGSVESWTHYDIIKESYERSSGRLLVA